MRIKTTIMALFAMTIAASALTIGDSRTLGLIDPNHPANPTVSADFINTLLDPSLVPLGSGPTQIGDNEYTRTLNDPLGGVYPDADATTMLDYGGAAAVSAGGVLDFGGVTYLYLLAKYDGPNYGSVIWYIGGLSGATIPTTADSFGLSNVYLYNPSGTPPPPPPPPVGVPDGGQTVALLGLGIMGIGGLRKYLLLAEAVA